MTHTYTHKVKKKPQLLEPFNAITNKTNMGFNNQARARNSLDSGEVKVTGATSGAVMPPWYTALMSAVTEQKEHVGIVVLMAALTSETIISPGPGGAAVACLFLRHLDSTSTMTRFS